VWLVAILIGPPLFSRWPRWPRVAAFGDLSPTIIPQSWRRR
jgi:hypothetical protein